MKNETINKRRAARVARGLRQSDLARTVGISQSRLSRIESGRLRPDPATMQRIAAVLRVPVSELFDGGAVVIRFPGRAAEAAR